MTNGRETEGEKGGREEWELRERGGGEAEEFARQFLVCFACTSFQAGPNSSQLKCLLTEARLANHHHPISLIASAAYHHEEADPYLVQGGFDDAR